MIMHVMYGIIKGLCNTQMLYFSRIIKLFIILKIHCAIEISYHTRLVNAIENLCRSCMGNTIWILEVEYIDFLKIRTNSMMENLLNMVQFFFKVIDCKKNYLLFEIPSCYIDVICNGHFCLPFIFRNSKYVNSLCWSRLELDL